MAGDRFPGKRREPVKTANKMCEEQIHAEGEEG